MNLLIQHDPNDLKAVNCIYQIECLITGDKYVGQTKCMKTRIQLHLGCHSKSEKSNASNRTELYEDARKYGWENFKLTILAKDVNDKKMRVSYFEQYCQGRLEYSRYARKDLCRDTRLKRSNQYLKLFDTVDKTYTYYKTPIEALRVINSITKRNYHRSNIIKAMRNNYRLARRWNVYDSSKEEYMNSVGQSSLV